MLRLHVNYRLINDSPYSSNNHNAFVSNEVRVPTFLSREIIHGNLTGVLISGYRGVGKTSFVEKLKSDIMLPDNKVLFVKLNIAKYETYAIVLRQIIRQIYLTLLKEELLDKLSNRAEIELIYERTFSDIQANNKQTEINEIKVEATAEVNLIKLIPPLVATLGTGLATLLLYVVDRFPYAASLMQRFFSSSFAESLSLIGFVCSLIWAATTALKLNASALKKSTHTKELNRKTLYDDEIAECRLLTVLEDIKNQGFKLLFVIDELDKIDDEDGRLAKLISDLKPLILSGFGTFILVSGQSLYYKYHTAQVKDDNIVASMFSRVVHIPLFSSTDFFELFKAILFNENDISEDKYRDYVSSKILQSNRLPRRFINLIRQDLIWEGDHAYLQILDENTSAYSTDNKILQIVGDLERDELNMYKEGIKDFLIFQLHIWIQRMKMRNGTEFSYEEIINREEYKDEFTNWYLYDLEKLLTAQLNLLVEHSLLERVQVMDDNGEYEIYYKWSSNAVIKTDSLDESTGPAESKFLKDFIDLEILLKIIIADISKNSQPLIGMNAIIKALKDHRIISDEYNALKKINDYRTRLSAGEKINLEEISIVSDLKMKLTPIKGRIVEKHVLRVVEDFFEGVSNTYVIGTLATDAALDVQAISQSLPNFYFVIKTSTGINSSMIKRFYEMLNEFYLSLKSNKPNYVVLVTYLRDKDEARLTSVVKREFNHNNRFSKNILWCNITQQGDLRKFLTEEISCLIPNYMNNSENDESSTA